MKTKQQQRWLWAANLARVAMGRNPSVRGAKGTWRAEDDPLAWWCLTEAIALGPRTQDPTR